MNIETRLGIDFGRVIQGGALAPGSADTAFLGGSLEQALASPATDGAFDVLPDLIGLVDGRAWIISKAGDRVRARTLAWLDHHDFYRRTGLPRGNVRFCRKRQEKAGHCAELGITHMIDDRLDVHRALRGTVPHLYLFGPQRDAVPGWVRHVPAWTDAGVISADIRAGRTPSATRRSR
ncbi:hypothetical protein BJF79_10695 [Actinomadura sp. CNU-125]|uniref:hypothetical protein n=1 Tax=Actinomadura sp. CNU-125 TaxID=1904961 RepID=UPI0009625E86|nr:hypothetical protein [Actinomadura sp. CNU-125]OLT28965.1 hypothetical protein BJF79_10695 [Actinomadura sp. CNU-125]